MTGNLLQEHYNDAAIRWILSAEMNSLGFRHLEKRLGPLFQIAFEQQNHSPLAGSSDESLRIGLLAGAIEHRSGGKLLQMRAFLLNDGNERICQTVRDGGH